MEEKSIYEILRKNRSYRRFYEEKSISKENLYSLVELARLSPSGANRQALRFCVINDTVMNEKVFSTLRWAGYLKDWDGPRIGERPSAYIIIVSEQQNSTAHDEGIAAQSILIGATYQNLGGCILGNIDREQLAKELGLDEKFNIKLVIALGYPKENVVITDIKEGEDIKYYRDEQGNHYVPKILLEDLLININ